MHSFRKHVAELFNSQEPVRDKTGCLRAVRSRLSSWEAQSAFIASADGLMQWIDPDTPEPLLEQVRTVAARIAPAVASDDAGIVWRDGFFGATIPTRGARGLFLGALLEDTRAARPSDEELRTLAELSWSGIRLAVALDEQEVRNRHLFNEQAALREACDNANAELMEVKESHLIAQRRVRQELEDAVRERTRALRSGLGRAVRHAHVHSDRWLRRRERLQEPLELILREANALQDKTHPADRVRQTAARLLRAGRKLQAMLEDSHRDDAEQDPRPPRRERGRLWESIADVIAAARLSAEEKGLRFVVEPAAGVLDSIEMDLAGVRTILARLLHGAVQYTQHGSVTLRAESSGDAREIEFQVCDTGRGMNPAQVNEIFVTQPAQGLLNAPSPDAARFSLAACQNLAEAAGGSLTVRSRPNVGSTFILRTPIRVATESALGDRDALSAATNFVTCPAHFARCPDAPLDDARILLVEDSSDRLRHLVFVLRRGGARIRQLSDANDAVSVMIDARQSGCAFDIILLHLDTLDIDLRATTAKFRAEGFVGPLVALTSCLDDAADTHCADAGVNECLELPVKKETIIETIHNLVGKSRVAAQR